MMLNGRKKKKKKKSKCCFFRHSELPLPLLVISGSISIGMLMLVHITCTNVFPTLFACIRESHSMQYLEFAVILVPSKNSKKKETLPRIIRESIWDKIKREKLSRAIRWSQVHLVFPFFVRGHNLGIKFIISVGSKGIWDVHQVISTLSVFNHPKTVFGLFTKCMVLGNFMSFDWDFLENAIILSLSGKTSEMKLLLKYLKCFWIAEILHEL